MGWSSFLPGLASVHLRIQSPSMPTGSLFLGPLKQVEKLPEGRKQEPKHSPFKEQLLAHVGALGTLDQGQKRTSLGCPLEQPRAETVFHTALPLGPVVTAGPAKQAPRPGNCQQPATHCTRT